MVTRHETGRVSTDPSGRKSADYRAFVQGDGQVMRGQVDTLVLTDSQQQILSLLDDRPAHKHKEATVAVEEARSFGVDIAFAVMGSVSILAGITMLFFFAAMGGILLVTGVILCAVAFEHVALSSAVGDELEMTPDMTASAVDPRLS